ncbi:hypothetical protein ACJX0J_037663 [Zea mays]
MPNLGAVTTQHVSSNIFLSLLINTAATMVNVSLCIEIQNYEILKPKGVVLLSLLVNTATTMNVSLCIEIQNYEINPAAVHQLVQLHLKAQLRYKNAKNNMICFYDVAKPYSELRTIERQEPDD